VLWDVYGECRNYGVLSGHKNAVLEVQWSYDSQQIVSASADKTVGVWDTTVRAGEGASGSFPMSLIATSLHIDWCTCQEILRPLRCRQ
jgi:WD40 repeat protein